MLHALFILFQAKHAEQFGALGLIMYSDPADYALGNTKVYPENSFLPPTGVQRGSLKILGDPLTPGYPSIGACLFVYRNIFCC